MCIFVVSKDLIQIAFGVHCKIIKVFLINA
jgi:hypothetical protein